jgi:hypothetical protein
MVRTYDTERKGTVMKREGKEHNNEKKKGIGEKGGTSR